jgi:hypothetical protein
MEITTGQVHMPGASGTCLFGLRSALAAVRLGLSPANSWHPGQPHLLTLLEQLFATPSVESVDVVSNSSTITKVVAAASETVPTLNDDVRLY